MIVRLKVCKTEVTYTNNEFQFYDSPIKRVKKHT